MTNQLTKLENILGGKIEQRGERAIPGVTQVEGQRVVYFADDSKSSFRKQFKNLTNFTNPPHATNGGVNERGCRIELPDGQLFHAISYHGDIDGWTKDIEAGAQALDLLLGRIEGNTFLVSDGREFSLVDCKIQFS